MNQTTRGAVLSFVIAVWSFGCESMEPTEQQFSSLSFKERRAAIVQFQPADQLELLILANQSSHPDDMGLAGAIAQQGEAMVPAIMDRLSVENDPSIQFTLIAILLFMDSAKNYPTLDDSGIVTVISEICKKQMSGIGAEFQKGFPCTQEKLQEKINSKDTPPDIYKSR